MEDSGFLLVDTKNDFNKINLIRMLCTVPHLWPSGARFVFNFYRHLSFLILQKGIGTASFIHNMEGVTQGYPLDMVAYGMGIIPLIKT